MVINAIKGDLLSCIDYWRLDAIMNAANGTGPMGRGIAGAIRRAGGTEIQSEAFGVCKSQDPQEGDAYYTGAGRLKCRYVIHAVTMKKPGGPTSFDIVSEAFTSALNMCHRLGVQRIGCTALGTATGGLDPVRVAHIMCDIADRFSSTDVVFVDIDSNFINTISERYTEDAK